MGGSAELALAPDIRLDSNEGTIKVCLVHDSLKILCNQQSCAAGLSGLPVPVLAAVDGAALGGGAELALAADIRTISKRATVGFPETGLGIIPGVGGDELSTCQAVVQRTRISKPKGAP